MRRNIKMQVIGRRKMKLEALTPDPDNVKIHHPENIAVIKARLAKFGQYRDFVVWERGMVVLVGNGMLQAMRV